MLQSNSFDYLQESFGEVAVHIVRGLRYSSIHVSYHLRILDVVMAVSRYDDFGVVVVV